MTNITIDNPVLERRYSDYEIKMKFINFLEKDMKTKDLDLYEISESNLSDNSKKRLKDIDNLNFIEY